MVFVKSRIFIVYTISFNGYFDCDPAIYEINHKINKTVENAMKCTQTWMQLHQESYQIWFKLSSQIAIINRKTVIIKHKKNDRNDKVK